MKNITREKRVCCPAGSPRLEELDLNLRARKARVSETFVIII